VPPPPNGTRRDHLTRLEDSGEVDVLVIGGGIVGAGVALDLASRGLSVAIVDQMDFASGTSSRSTKLIHGGIRYLPQFRFGLVREGLQEQKVLARTADYLYEPLDFVIPIYEDRGFGDVPVWARHRLVFPLALRAGLWVYDVLGGRLFNSKLRHKTVSPEAAVAMVPGLKQNKLKRAFIYHDARTDDARLVLAVVKSTVATGRGLAVSWTRVARIRAAGDGFSAELHDELGDRDFTVRARAIVSATGAFAPPPGPAGTRRLEVVPSKGVHLVTTPEAVGLEDIAVVLPETDDKRLMYVVPWLDHAIVGTTDTPYSGDFAHPATDPSDVDYLVRHLEGYMDAAGAPLLSSWAGLRALVAADSGSTASASREHTLHEVAPGYLQVAGGKLSGYRRIAAKAGKRVARHLGSKARSSTSKRLLVGAGAPDGYATALGRRAHSVGLPRSYGRLLYRRLGRDSDTVMALLEAQPALRERLGDGSTLAEVRYAATHEGAAAVSDFALRRTRLSWFTADHGRADAERIADELSDTLGWDADYRKQQVERFHDELQAERL